MIDASAPTITLSRSDEDYFLKADRPATVNEAPCTTRLLNSGDRIGLGTRCRLTFRRPSAASGTAVLDISGGRLPAAGIRQVILIGSRDRHRPRRRRPYSSRRIAGAGGADARAMRDWPVEAPRRLLSTADPSAKPRIFRLDAAISIGSLRFVISREQRP